MSAMAKQIKDVWPEVMAMGEFSKNSLAERFDLHENIVRGWIRAWENTGQIVMTSKKVNRRFYTAVDRLPVEDENGDLKPSVNGNMWRSMRLLPTFTPFDLKLHSTAGGIEVTEQAARLYCTYLMKAGYLRVIERAQPGVRHARYRLVVNSGPKPPKLRRIQAIWDPNTKEDVVLEGQAPS